MELMGERGCDPDLELPPVSVPSAHFPVPGTRTSRTETGPPSSSLRLGIRGGGGGGGWRGSPSSWKGKERNACGRAVCATGGTKKDGQCRGVDDGDWHCQQGWGACSPKNALTEDGPDLKVQAHLPCHPVAQGPVSSGRPGPRCIRCEKGGSVGPVRPLLPGVAVQFSLTHLSRSQFRPSVCSLFFFCLLSRAPPVCCSTAATPTHTQTQW